MSKPVITVEGLSKQYRIGVRERHDTMRDSIMHVMKTPLRYFRRRGKPLPEEETIWALKDVSFEVQEGEVVGIIGSNGAGKSTLLKILTGIMEPTAGYAELRGRIASLLEVGTGFHPELTGRENIYLSGAIRGMKKTEIDRKFDEIVDFSGVEKFIDTPIKRYSSGMGVRLGFAVAVHLEPEILLVDEVLAVGDAQFQKKCLEKMTEIGRGGRTILFVSHNMSAIRHICHRGLILESGFLTEQGEVNDVVDKYLARITQEQTNQSAVETESFVVNDVQIYSVNGNVIKTFDPVEIRVRFIAKTDILDPGLYIGILSLENQRLTGLDFKDFLTVAPIQAGQQRELGFSLATLPILPGTYQLELYLKDMATHKIELVPQTFPFEIVETPIYGGRKIDRWYGHIGLKAQAVAHTP